MASIAQLPAQLDPLVELQRGYGIIVLSGELYIVDRQQIADLKAGRLTGQVWFYKRADAALLMRRYLETLNISSDPKKVLAEFWISTNTHVYNEIAFSPLPTPATTLNLYSPSPIRPAQGDWKVIHEFLLETICDGNSGLFSYLLQYMAHMLQKPEEKPGVMLVMLGGQGTGKGTFFALIQTLWPRTTLPVSDVEHIIGTFNVPLEQTFAVCLDEAIFSGDRKSQDRLKSMITEPRITIEAKYQPRRTIESFHRFFAASNHDHFARVESDDRRFVFIRVSTSRQNDHAYFDALHTAFANPAVIAAMAHDLLAMDLSRFNVRQRPKTAEHTEQKLQSLDGFDRYWYEILQTGCFDLDEVSWDLWQGGRFINTATLKRQCDLLQRAVRQHQVLTQQDICKALKKWCSSAARCRRAINGNQARGYVLPALDVARREFETAIGAKVEWPNDDEVPEIQHETGGATS